MTKQDVEQLAYRVAEMVFEAHGQSVKGLEQGTIKVEWETPLQDISRDMCPHRPKSLSMVRVVDAIPITITVRIMSVAGTSFYDTGRRGMHAVEDEQ